MDTKTIFHYIKQQLIEQVIANDIDLNSIKLTSTQTDYSVKIDKTVFYKITTNKDKQTFIRISKQHKNAIKTTQTECITTKDGNFLLLIQDNNDLNKALEPLRIIFDKITLPEVAHFGCCSRYVACSDAKQCIHPDKNTAKACGYRVNLEAGKIFYGNNKNI